MFEQAVLPARPATTRYWAAAIGLGGQLLVITSLFLAPLIWPQLLPRAVFQSWIAAPSPPPAAPKEPTPTRVRPVHPWQSVGITLVTPRFIPSTPQMIEDPPDAAPSAGVVGGDAGGHGISNIISTLINLPPPPARVADPPAMQAAPAATTPAVPRRISAVKMARVIHRVEPAYPVLARQTRISGTVELQGVVGTDGHIRELRVVSGHPFLATAALEAVRQWIYEPTMLNGEPVEVAAPITVVFRLN
jgi:protein TonB